MKVLAPELAGQSDMKSTEAHPLQNNTGCSLSRMHVHDPCKQARPQTAPAKRRCEEVHLHRRHDIRPHRARHSLCPSEENYGT